MNATLARLVDAMRAEGLIAADAPAPPEADHDRPWFIALLQGFAGWLAGIFLLVFLGFVFKPDERGSILLLGAVLLVAAWLIYRADREGLFLDQFALALSIAGQFAVAWGVIGDDFHGLTLALSVLVMQVVLWLVMPNGTARTLAALFATIAWVYTIRFLMRPAISGEEVFGISFGARAPPPGAWTSALGWLLTWAPMIAAAYWLISRETWWLARGWAAHARPALTGLLLGLAAGGIAGEPFAMLVLGMEQVGIGFNLWALFPLLSVGLAGFAAWCAFRVRSAGLVGVAALAGLLHLSRFYYLYGTTLLWKSLIMLGLGAALLGLGHALRGEPRRMAP